MPLIIDPDNLSQGLSTAAPTTVFSASAGDTTTITDTGNLPALASGEFFEIRDHSVAGNNGLYSVTTVTTSTTEYIIKKITGINPVNAGSEAIITLGATGAANEKSVHLDTATKILYLLEQGNLSVDGVTMLALHSFFKIQWKSDQYLMDTAEFPMVGISFAAGQWIFGQDPSGNNSGWKPAENDATNSIFTRQLVRNAGWDEVNSQGIVLKKVFNVTTLGTFEDNINDKAFYRFGTDATDTGAAVDYVYAGPVNEIVEYFTEIGNLAGDTPSFASTSTIIRTTGSFITDGFTVGGQVTVNDSTTNDGTFVLTDVTALTLTVSGTPLSVEAFGSSRIAVNNDNVFSTFLRVRDGDANGKAYGQSNLAGAGETAVTSKIIKFPLANSTDTNISETDANISTILPYTEIRLRYLATAYNREVDSTIKRAFGIIADVGTYSRENGASATTTTFTSADHTLGAGESLADYAGGTLIIHEGADQGSHTVSGTPTDAAGTLTIVLTVALTATESNLSFTLQRAAPVAASKQEIFEKVQYQLRQAADIDETLNSVIGKTADELMVFIGADLQNGSVDGGVSFPVNPNGGGSGLIIEGFDTNDTNNLFFYDNVGTKYNFPFVAAGTFTFSQTLVDDIDGEYWLYYDRTVRNSPVNADTVTPSGSTFQLTADSGIGTGHLVGDYLRISNFAQVENNGLYIITVVTASDTDITVRKIDGTPVGTAETNISGVFVDEHPYPSPNSILVNDNGGTPLAADINSLTLAFDFDYENNVQGGRTADSVADVVLVAAGADQAQVAVVKGLQITKNTGLSFSVTSPLERNFSNPV